MSGSDVLLITLVRCVVLATLGVWPSSVISNHVLRAFSARQSQFLLIAAVTPIFVPELLTGFTYRLLAAQLVRSETATELLYGGLMLIRCVSAAVCLRLMLGESRIRREAIHSWQLLKPEQSGFRWELSRLRLLVMGPWRASVIAWCLMLLISFQEFETAALLQIDRYPVSWAVWLFDAHAARQPLQDTLRMIAGPLLLQLAILALVTPVFLGGQPSASDDPETAERPSHTTPSAALTLIGLTWIVVTLGVAIVWPVVANVAPLLTGITSLPGQTALLTQTFRQILVSLAFAGAGAVVSLRTASVLLAARRPLVVMIAVLPGLCGSLTVSLMLLTLFQLPGIRSLYDTWLPMLLGSAISVLPRAVLTVALLNTLSQHYSLHSARLLLASADSKVRQTAQHLIWRLRSFGWFIAGIVVTHWCFWDVTVASILRPVRLEPIVTRLYNEMHYGRTEAILLITFVAVITPILSGLGAMSLWRWASRRILRRSQNRNGL